MTEKQIEKNNYFSIDLISNIRASLGRYFFLWFIPIGEGYERNIKLPGYEFSTNVAKFMQYCDEKADIKKPSSVKSNPTSNGINKLKAPFN